jgi:hypothetical protein
MAKQQQASLHKRDNQRGRSRRTTARYANAIDEIERQEYTNNIHSYRLEHYANAVTDETTGKQLEYRKLLNHPEYRTIWTPSAANEFGRLAQGVGGRVPRKDTMFVIHKHQIPQARKVTYP